MSVEELRQQLRERGYLTHGIERWFALDPWGSRTFWQELALVAAKAAALIAAFGALAPAAVMLLRNAPLTAVETLVLYLGYAAAWLVAASVLVVLVALGLKLRPSLPIDTPRALLAISLAAGAALLVPMALWWAGFDAWPEPVELAVGGTFIVVFFLVAGVVVSAALLSFSIYEMQRVPAIHQRPRTVPMSIGAAVLAALLFLPALARRDRDTPAAMVVVSPTAARVALIAVDGLTFDVARSRPELSAALPHVFAASTIPGESTTERWASLGTGVATEAHQVRSIEGVRFAGGQHVLQQISRADFVLMDALPRLGLARREPLPPTVRRRDYLWEIVAARGIPAVAINWWATSDGAQGGLRSVGPESVFSAASGDPLRVDALAAARFRQAIERDRPRLATVYLPALDVILNRIEIDPAARLARSLRALEGVEQVVAAARAHGYEIVLAGLPGETQSGTAVIASTIALRADSPRSWDVAPTVLDLLGFPRSAEMPGVSLLGGKPQPSISGYGVRDAGPPPAEMNRDYYENLRSLGYIR